MKISELETALAEAKLKYGDIEISIGTQEGRYDESIAVEYLVGVGHLPSQLVLIQ